MRPLLIVLAALLIGGCAWRVDDTSNGGTLIETKPAWPACDRGVAIGGGTGTTPRVGGGIEGP